MEAIKCIETRRSVRRFTTQNVSNEDLAKIIEVTKFAPSWKNSQTSKYIAIKNKEIQQRIANECMLGFKGNQDIIASAPVLVVQTTTNGRSGYERDGSFTTSKGTHWQSYDAGISAQTFCLTAHEYGLSTVIMGIFDESKIIEMLSLDSTLSVSSLIALGYQADIPVAPKRKETTDILTIIE